MPIARRPARRPTDQKALENWISNAGQSDAPEPAPSSAVPTPGGSAAPAEDRPLSIRLPLSVIAQIDSLRGRIPFNPSRSAWIRAAIEEKLARDGE